MTSAFCETITGELALPEFAVNYGPRCPVLLAADTSGSMAGPPIEELTRGVASFKEDVLKDSQASLSIEVAVLTFGGRVQKIQDFVTVDNFNPPILKAEGHEQT